MVLILLNLGVTPLSNVTAGIQSTNLVGLNVLQMPTGNFNAVRSGIK